jgi:hypothetical protein
LNVVDVKDHLSEAYRASEGYHVQRL